jgi:predicted nuclease with TOPRIM domain
MSETEEKKDDFIREVEVDGETMKVVSAEKFEELQKQNEQVLAEKAEKEAELEKEKSKGKNFAALRAKRLSELSDEEKAELTEREQAIMARQEEVDTKIDAWEKEKQESQQKQTQSWKTAAFQQLGLVDADGNVLDEDAHKRVDAAFARLNDPEDSAGAVLRKVKSAYSLEFGRQPSIGETTVHSAVPFGGAGGPARKQGGSYAETEAGKGLAASLGMDIAKPKEEKK